MSSKTFILKIEKESKDLVEDEDVVNILAIRMIEVYLIETSIEKVGMDAIQRIKKLILDNLKHDKNYLLYSVDVDFEKDISV